MGTTPPGVRGRSVQLLVVGEFRRGQGLVRIQNHRMEERIVLYLALLPKHKAVTHNHVQVSFTIHHLSVMVECMISS